MKKVLSILVLTLIVSAKGFSQTTNSNDGFVQRIVNRLEFGLTAGANYSNFTKANFSTDGLPGYHTGFTVAYKFTDNFMVDEEFLYSLEGAKVKDGTFGGQDIKLSYVNIPIMLKYRTDAGIYIEAGGEAGVKVREDLGGITDSKFANKTDFGAIGGIGYQTKIGLGIDVRYVYGLQKVPNTPSATLGDFKNNSAQASIFYIFK